MCIRDRHKTIWSRVCPGACIILNSFKLVVILLPSEIKLTEMEFNFEGENTFTSGYALTKPATPDVWSLWWWVIKI